MTQYVADYAVNHGSTYENEAVKGSNKAEVIAEIKRLAKASTPRGEQYRWQVRADGEIVESGEGVRPLND